MLGLLRRGPTYISVVFIDLDLICAGRAAYVLCERFLSATSYFRASYFRASYFRASYFRASYFRASYFRVDCCCLTNVDAFILPLVMAARLRCTLGELLGEECNDGTILRVTKDEKELLLLRTGHSVTEVCSHHRAAYIQYYSWKQKKCCDPLGHHPNKAMTRSLRVITAAMIDTWNITNLKLVPGQKLCTLCRESL